VSRPALVPTQPTIQWVPGALSLGVKRSGLEADHSPLSSAKVKNALNYTSTPPYIFMKWCLINIACIVFILKFRLNENLYIMTNLKVNMYIMADF
jgi:hypothetical protein